MKRVIGFLDMFDKIPDNSKYLFSRNVLISFPIKENAVIETTGGALNLVPEEDSMQSTYIHYYEVESSDIEELVDNQFFKKSSTEKIKEFMKEYKVSIKSDDKEHE